MVEKIKAVTNPLTIVAIFATLAEIAGTVALATVDKSIQPTFIWFVMGFPLTLVLLFFATLNFNPKVLYAPSDFQNEENFVAIIQQTRSVSAGIEIVTREFEEARNKIEALSVEKAAGEAKEKSLKSITENLSRVEAELDKVRQKADFAAWSAARSTKFEIKAPERGRAAEQRARRAIRRVLGTESGGSTLDFVLKELGMDRELAVQCLSRMCGMGIVIADERDGHTFYRLPSVDGNRTA